MLVREAQLEFLQAVRNLANKESLPASFRSTFALADWENFVIREQWMGFWANQFDELLGTFQIVHELPYRELVWHELPRLLEVGPMAAYDAFHLATSISYQIPEIWTTDQTHAYRVTVSVQAVPAASDHWRALARRVETLGFDSLLVPDHPGTAPAPAVETVLPPKVLKYRAWLPKASMSSALPFRGRHGCR
jgi:predicted nucleic acid-binding protein